MIIETLRKIRGIWIKNKAKVDKGQAHLNFFLGFFQLNALVAILIKLFFGDKITIPFLILGISDIFLLILLWVVGWLDQEKLHLTQAENEYNWRHLHPWFEKHCQKTEEILKEIKKNGNK